jgi:hypothetical protein
MVATLLRELLHNLDLRYPPGDPALEKSPWSECVSPWA